MTAKDMDTKRLKREFRKDLTFWGGGCDTQNVLPFGSPEEVGEEVKQRVEDSVPGGGFVFTQVHNIQAGVPVGRTALTSFRARLQTHYTRILR
ncbi:MAG: hypothetical protein J7M27_08245 [Candidatus Latescibacteria bacterium]|nr:hypothetical protein [Candidatus Latescibacterota bacterium]